MAKDYNIKLSDYEYLLHLLENHNDGSKLINKDIALLKYFIRRVKHQFYIPGEDSSDYFTRALEDLSDIQSASKVISILEEYPTYFHIEYPTTPSYQSILISDRKAVEIATHFFQKQNEVFYSDFLDVFDELPDHLKFIKPNPHTSGETHFIRTTGDAFIYVPNYSNISKVTILIHEIQHVIDTMENENFWYQPLIKEIAAVFMELVSTDYVSKELGLGNEGDKRKAEVHQIVSGDSSMLIDKKDMLERLVNKGITNSNQLVAELKKYDYSEDDIDSILFSSADSLISYQLPQYVAIELYYLYQSHKSKALQILLDIIRYGNDENIFEILGTYGINPGTHLHQYEESLGKSLQIKRS